VLGEGLGEGMEQGKVAVEDQGRDILFLTPGKIPQFVGVPCDKSFLLCPGPSLDLFFPLNRYGFGRCFFKIG
jgi:hypothetical protein